MNRLAPLVIMALLVLALPREVRADALADFDEASAAYREQRYALAAAEFEVVIATTVAGAADPAILLEARKYLAACYLFLNRPADTDRQFELLLELDPSYRVDPAVFPHEVIERFENVRRRREAERFAELEAELEAARSLERAQRDALAIEAARYERLHRFASESLVIRRNSRLVAALPFGIGQFQNGARRRGRWFAITQGIALGGYIGGYVWRRVIEDIVPQAEHRLEWERQMRSSLALNWSSGLAFLTLGVAGIVEAEANFVPTVESTRRRQVPQSLRPIEPEARLRVSPFGASFELRF